MFLIKTIETLGTLKLIIKVTYIHFFSNYKVLTQEDWNEVLYNGMEKTSSWAALYFIALMTFGNYVLFNLLVAILVEGFSTEVSKFLIIIWY
jgi:hypothetical protein